MNGPHGNARLTAGLAVMALLLPTAVSAQEGGPLLKSDLVRMMTASNYTATEMAAIVRMNCVGFEPTDRDRSQLGNLPNADIVMAEVDRCMSRGRTTPERRGATRPAADPPAETKVVRAPPRPRQQIDLGEIDIAGADQTVPGLRRPNETGGATAAAPATTGSSSEAPATTVTSDFDRPPELKNWKAVSSAFLREYRPNVRQPGSVLLWLRVGPDGRVVESRVKRATGDPVMADAALRVTKVMEFEPATKRGRSVESWTELPINFSSK